MECDNMIYEPTIVKIESDDTGCNVLVADKNGNYPSIWVDCWNFMDELQVDFNAYIFNVYNMSIKEFQESDNGLAALEYVYDHIGEYA